MLRLLAHNFRIRYRAPRIGLTGSQEKTAQEMWGPQWPGTHQSTEEISEPIFPYASYLWSFVRYTYLPPCPA